MVYRLIAVMSMLAAGCGDYDPPPEVAGTNLARGTYDPARGDIVVRLSEPIDEASLQVQIVTSRYSEELDLCVPADALPKGCDSAATVVIDSDSDLIRLNDERTEIRIDGAGLELFTKYVVRIAGGLRDDAGRTRDPDSLIPFFARGNVQGTPTTFESGLFFGRLTTTVPLPIKVTLYFWIEVDSDEGLVKLFGCDADPTNGGPDSTEDSMKQEKWKADPLPPLGFTVLANGLIQEGAEETIMELLPFDLEVTTPPVVAGDAIFRGTIGPGTPPGDVGGTRQLVAGQLDAETVSLGGTLLDGVAQGDLVLFRLDEGEGPPLSALLGEGVTEEDVHSTFED